MEKKRKDNTYPGFKSLVDFLEAEAGEANDPVYGSMGQKAEARTITNNKQSSSFSTQVVRQPPCILCRQDHKLFYCAEFKAMRIADRLQVVSENKLCHNCLMSNHITDECKNLYVCTISGCGKKHSKFLHMFNPPVQNVKMIERILCLL